MSRTQKSLSVSMAAAFCGVGRTTVGYWIRSKKLHAQRVGRNYTIPVEDLLFFLKNRGQKIPPELIHECSNKSIFKSFQNCWQHWDDGEHARKCHDCIAFKNQLQACFTVKDTGLLGCSECDSCRYYLETFFARIQFVHQIDIPAAVFQNLYLWGGNSQCAEICGVEPKDLVGMGIEKIVHSDSLAKVIEALRKMAIGDPGLAESCSLSIKNGHGGQRQIRVSVYPLREPSGTFLVLGDPKNRN